MAARSIAAAESPMDGRSSGRSAKEDGLLGAAKEALTGARRRGGIDVQNDEDILMQ